MSNDYRVFTFMGIAGSTRWDAFRSWVTRVRRHIGWRLIRGELDAYVDRSAKDMGSENWCHEDAWIALLQFRDWIHGPSTWSRDGRVRLQRDLNAPRVKPGRTP